MWWIRVHLLMQGTRVRSWSGKIPHATEQLSPCATATEPALRNSLHKDLILSGLSVWLFFCHLIGQGSPGTGKPGGLPSMGSHRVGHDLSDLAAAAGV